MIGGLAGAGIAVGPLLGGWMTTYLSWRFVFAGEVIVVLFILLTVRWIADAPPTGPRRRLDAVGATLSVVGLALVVLGVLQSGAWGWLRPLDPPVTVLGFSPTPFVIVAGLVVLGLLRGRLRRRESRGLDPLIRWGLFGVPPLRAALETLVAQNLILLGLFFTIPLYLQVVHGLNAFETGLRLLPVSVTMLVTSMCAPLLNRVASPRTVARIAFAVLFVATIWLVATVRPELDDVSFAVAMAILGIGMGLLAAQLGNVAQSSVGDSERSEVGGLQYTAQNLGSSLGTALIGSVVVGALTVTALTGVQDDPRISDAVQEQVGVAVAGSVQFVPIDQVRLALVDAQVPPAEATVILATYADAQLQALRIALLVAAAIALLSLFLTRGLPRTRLAEPAGEPERGPADTGDRTPRAPAPAPPRLRPS